MVKTKKLFFIDHVMSEKTVLKSLEETSKENSLDSGSKMTIQWTALCCVREPFA